MGTFGLGCGQHAWMPRGGGAGRGGVLISVALDTKLFGEPAGMRPGCIEGILHSGSSLLTNTTVG